MRVFRAYLILLITAMLFVFALPFTCVNTYTASAEVTKTVYLGGFPVGISLDIGGLLIEEVTGVETEYGVAYADGLCKDDIITAINGQAVKSVGDIPIELGSVCTVKLMRGGSELNVEVHPPIELYSGKPKLGVKIKDKVYGVGTVCYVRADGHYAALGHEISDGQNLPFYGGTVGKCRILGVKKGKRGEAGSILASIVPNSELGTVACNNCFGIAGRLFSELPYKQQIQVAERSEVHSGAAKIKCAVSGVPELYDIEIIKAVRQNGRKEKGLIFRVTDGRLLELAGGVVRGMSGSPIIQDGKLIGAVTHVFLNDFTKGYGVYVDCLN